MLNEIHKPLGMLNAGVDLESQQARDALESKKREYYRRKRIFKESKNKKVILTNADILKTLGPLDLLNYGDKIHFKDACVALSKKAVVARASGLEEYKNMTEKERKNMSESERNKKE